MCACIPKCGNCCRDGISLLFLLLCFSLNVYRYGYDVALARKVVHVGLTRRLMVDLYPLAVHCVKVGSRGREDIVEKV